MPYARPRSNSTTHGRAGHARELGLVGRDVLHVALLATTPALIRKRLPLARLTAYADNLLLGPSAFEFEEHVALRSQFWRARGLSAVDADLRRLRARLGQAARIFIWPESPSHRVLELLHVLHLLKPKSGGRLRHAVCFVQRKEDGPLFTRSLQPELLGRASALWRAFVASSPARFDRVGRQSSASVAGLPATLRARSSLFPTVSVDSLRLSRIDEGIVAAARSLGEQATPARIFSVLSRQAALRAAVSSLGDLSMALRIVELCRARNPLIAMDLIEMDPAGVAAIRSLSPVRLTERGMSVLTHGLDDLCDVPPVQTGGVVAYLDPWVFDPRRKAYRIWRRHNVSAARYPIGD